MQLDGSLKAQLMLDQWDRLKRSECKKLARHLGRALPASFSFAHMATYKVGTQRRHIAHFKWRPSAKQAPILFALIPGATATLGFDQMHPFAVEEALVLSWQRYCIDLQSIPVDTTSAARDQRLELEYRIARKTFAHHGEQIEKDPLRPHHEAFYEYLTHILQPLRTVTLQPLLVEVGIENASKVLPPPVATYFRSFSETTGQRQIHADRKGHYTIPHRHVVAFLRQHGFRLLTADEWEYACAAGSRTLFFWDIALQKPDITLKSWMAQRNAFGLSMVRDTYQWECVLDPSIMTGGDGGWAECGSGNRFAQTIPHASAYRLPLNGEEINRGIYKPWFHRVYDLERLF